MSAILSAILDTIMRVLTMAVQAWVFYRAGKASAQNDATEHEARIKDEQARKAAERPHDRDELVRRLRERGL